MSNRSKSQKKVPKKEQRRIQEISRQTESRKPLPSVETGAEEYTSDVGSNLSNKQLAQSYAGRLASKEKHRFHRETGMMRSLYGDVNFGHRSTIMDELINNALTGESFKGAGWGRIKPKAPGEAGKGESSELVFFNFSGFYVLFWMIVAFIVLRVGVDYYVIHNGDLSQSEILRFMTTDIFAVAFIDLVMYLCTYFVLFVQLAIKRNFITWKRAGWYLTSAYEIAFVIVFLYVAESVMKFHWVAKIFIFLHSLVLLMKMHSFAFYNGYLWDIKEELEFSKKTLAKYKDVTIENGYKEALEKSCEFCEFELKSHSDGITFPNNLTYKGFFWYTMFPTLVYQTEYPRTEKIRWGYVFEKLALCYLWRDSCNDDRGTILYVPYCYSCNGGA